MRIIRRVVSYNSVNGVGVVRDSRGRLTPLSNKKGNSKVYKGRSVYVFPATGVDIIK